MILRFYVDQNQTAQFDWPFVPRVGELVRFAADPRPHRVQAVEYLDRQGVTAPPWVNVHVKPEG